MIKKIGAFLEEHIEKIVLIIVGLLCSWLLVTRVLLSPNVVEYNRKPIASGKIDDQILDEAISISNKKVTEVPEIVMTTGEENYAKLMEDPLKDILLDFPPLAPGKSTLPPPKNPYQTPVIPTATKLDIEYMRTVAYEPKMPVTGKGPTRIVPVSRMISIWLQFRQNLTW